MSTDPIILPDMPVIEGLHFRSIYGEEDANVLHAIHAGRVAHDLDISVPLPAPILPAGMDVRPVLPEHYSLIAASIDEAYRNEYAEGRFQERFDPVDYAARLSAPKHDPTLWQVAWDGDQVAGQVLSLIENDRAKVFEVSVRPAWRRQKLGRALLTAAVHGLRVRGVEVIRLHTVAEFCTRASSLYRSVGFRVLKEFPRYRKSPA